MKYEDSASLNEFVNIGSAGNRAVQKTASYLTKGTYSPKQGAAILAKNLLSVVEGTPQDKIQWKMQRIAYLLYMASKSPATMQTLAQSAGQPEQPQAQQPQPQVQPQQ